MRNVKISDDKLIIQNNVLFHRFNRAIVYVMFPVEVLNLFIYRKAAQYGGSLLSQNLILSPIFSNTMSYSALNYI